MAEAYARKVLGNCQGTSGSDSSSTSLQTGAMVGTCAGRLALPGGQARGIARATPAGHALRPGAARLYSSAGTALGTSRVGIPPFELAPGRGVLPVGGTSRRLLRHERSQSPVHSACHRPVCLRTLARA